MFSVGGGHTDYRIPALCVDGNKNIFAAFECRFGPSDWAETDICVMKSEDGGKTFKERLLLKGNGRTLNNPTFVADGNTVHLFYCENYGRVFRIQSGDGNTWSAPFELTGVFSDVKHTVVALGPGHGTVTGDGTLVVPAWLAYDPDDKFAHRPSFLTTVYSRDGGKTWSRGETISHKDLIDPNESAVALTKNGSVLLSIRNIHPDKRLRFWAVSPDGYSGWEYKGFDGRFADPRCMGSMCNGGGKLFFCNCESNEDRTDLTVKSTEDDFETFSRTAISKKAGYSDIAYLDGELCVLYETSEKSGGIRKNHTLHFVKLNVG